MKQTNKPEPPSAQAVNTGFVWRNRKLSSLPSRRAVGFALGGIFIFLLGVNVGNGRIELPNLAGNPNQHLPAKLDYSSVDQVYKLIKNDYDGKLTTSQLLDGLKQGVASATGDPYTEYFNPKQAQEFNQELKGSFTGIGAELGKNANDDLIIVAPIEGSPAAKIGLKAQDIIANINGETTSDISIDKAVSKIRGPKGTKVTLKILRDKSEVLSFTIVRDEITVPSVESEVLNGNIGYVQISQFNEGAAQLTRQAAQKLYDAKVKGIILDLRNNPGGLLDGAVDVSSLWLPTGKTILTEKQDGKVVRTYAATGDTLLRGIPTVVLINGGSASAAEITAGALHDNKAARLIGTKSFGKGSVQAVHKLSDGSELKLTIAHWFRPNGQDISRKGISPDQTVDISSEDFKNNRDPQKDAALLWLTKK